MTRPDFEPTHPSATNEGLRRLSILYHRLEAWREERETNRNGLKHLADRAIALLEADIRELEERDQ